MGNRFPLWYIQGGTFAVCVNNSKDFIIMEKSKYEIALETDIALIQEKIREIATSGIVQAGTDGSQYTLISLDNMRKHLYNLRWELAHEQNRRNVSNGGADQTQLNYQFE